MDQYKEDKKKAANARNMVGTTWIILMTVLGVIGALLFEKLPTIYLIWLIIHPIVAAFLTIILDAKSLEKNITSTNYKSLRKGIIFELIIILVFELLVNWGSSNTLGIIIYLLSYALSCFIFINAVNNTINKKINSSTHDNNNQ